MCKSRLRNNEVEVTFLGTGDAFASHGRLQSAYLITGKDCRILMEAGPTVLTAMKRLELNPAEIDYILISHLHGDHFGGLPFLILEYAYENPRTRPLVVAGPRHLEARTWQLYRTMYPRPREEVARVAKQLRFVVLEPGVSKAIGSIRVAAIRTPHMRYDTSLALKVSLDGKTITFSGDSGWTDELIPFVAGSDLFMCECTYFDSTHLDFHLNYPLLETKRKDFAVRRMMLTHLGREVLDRHKEVAMEMASDGMRLRV